MRCLDCGYVSGDGDAPWCPWCEGPLEPEIRPPWWETLGVWLAIVGACLLFWAAVVRWLLP